MCTVCVQVHVWDRMKQRKRAHFLLYFHIWWRVFILHLRLPVILFGKAQVCFLQPFLPSRNCLFLRLQLLIILRNGFLYIKSQDTFLSMKFSPGNWEPCLSSSRLSVPGVCSDSADLERLLNSNIQTLQNLLNLIFILTFERGCFWQTCYKSSQFVICGRD